MTRNGLLCFIETSDKQLNGVTPFQLLEINRKFSSFSNSTYVTSSSFNRLLHHTEYIMYSLEFIPKSW